MTPGELVEVYNPYTKRSLYGIIKECDGEVVKIQGATGFYLEVLLERVIRRVEPETPKGRLILEALEELKEGMLISIVKKLEWERQIEDAP